MPVSPPPQPNADLLETLRHDLATQVTVIHGQAQLMRRRLERLDGLDEPDRAWLLERGARIDAAIMTAVACIDRIGEAREQVTPEQHGLRRDR